MYFPPTIGDPCIFVDRDGRGRLILEPGIVSGYGTVTTAHGERREVYVDIGGGTTIHATPDRVTENDPAHGPYGLGDIVKRMLAPVEPTAPDDLPATPPIATDDDPGMPF